MLWRRKHPEESAPALYHHPSPLQMVLIVKVYLLGFQICLYSALKGYLLHIPSLPGPSEIPCCLLKGTPIFVVPVIGLFTLSQHPTYIVTF